MAGRLCATEAGRFPVEAVRVDRRHTPQADDQIENIELAIAAPRGGGIRRIAVYRVEESRAYRGRPHASHGPERDDEVKKAQAIVTELPSVAGGAIAVHIARRRNWIDVTDQVPRR